MRGRLLRAIAAAALLAVAACGEETTTATRADPAPQSASAAAQRTAPSRRRAAEETAAIEPAPTEDVVAEKADATPADDKFEVTGSVVWADTEEAVENFEIGLLPPRLSSSSVERDPVDVKGTDGRYRVALPRDETWSVCRVAADGRPAVHCMVNVDVASGVAPALRIPRPGQATLRIVDGATRAPLPGARVIWANSPADERGEFQTGHLVPGSQRRLRMWHLPGRPDADGCIAFALDGRTGEFFVIADGYAWSSVRAGGDGPTEVRLVPGGSLLLSIPKWSELGAATVDTDVGSPGRMQLGPPDRDGTLRVNGLLAGRHTITVRRGAWFEDGVVYGSGEVDIVAGGEARLTIDADPGERRAKVAVTGSVVVPEAWRALPDGVFIEGAEPTNAELLEHAALSSSAAGRTMTFRFHEVPEGRYRVSIDPFQWRKEVVVGPGATTWTLELGPPAEIVVDVVEDATGAPATEAELSWTTRLEGQTSWSSEEASRRASDGAFVVRAPAGTVHLEASAPGRIRAREQVDVAAGAAAHVTLRLAAGALLKVRLERDGKPFTAERPRVDVRGRPGDRSVTSAITTTRDGYARLDGVVPGTYIVSLDEMQDWTCDEKTVDLRAGETTTVVLEVKKKP